MPRTRLLSSKRLLRSRASAFLAFEAFARVYEDPANIALAKRDREQNRPVA
jgi:hypothetical protein